MLNTLKVVGLTSLLIALASCGGGGSSSGGGSAVYTTQNNNVTTIAGTASTPGSADAPQGPGTAATFHYPTGIATDGTNLYVVDWGNNTIRKIEIATGAVTTIAGTAGTPGSADAPQGPGTAASFNYPYGITTDGTNLYVADTYNNTIRQIVLSTGDVSTLAGTAGTSGWADGTGSAAIFLNPMYITISPDGTNLYVTDSNMTIRKIEIATKAVTTLAGIPYILGSADGTGTIATFSFPTGIATDGTYLYVADWGNNTIRKIVIANGAVTTIAGTPGTTGFQDGTGTAARFNGLYGIATDGTNLYVADSGNSTIRKIVIASGDVRTVAGTPRSTGFQDGTGAGATFYSPAGIATYGTNLYVADTNNSTIRKIY